MFLCRLVVNYFKKNSLLSSSELSTNDRCCDGNIQRLCRFTLWRIVWNQKFSVNLCSKLRRYTISLISPLRSFRDERVLGYRCYYHPKAWHRQGSQQGDGLSTHSSLSSEALLLQYFPSLPAQPLDSSSQLSHANRKCFQFQTNLQFE